MGRLTYFQIVLFLCCGVASIGLTGCDVFNSDDDASNREPFFNFEVQDENGEVLTVASSEQLDGTEIETGIGLFGEQFISPEVIERFIETAEEAGIDRDKEDFRQLDMFLHAEKGINDNIHFVSLNFSFLRSEKWKEGRFQVVGLSREEWLDSIQLFWERARDRGLEQHDLLASTIFIFPPGTDEHSVWMQYKEAGFGKNHEYVFQPIKGFVELEHVSDEHAEGNFSVDLGALSSDILSGDQFPEDPGFRTFHISGNFVTEHGNYEDLEQVRSDIFREIVNARATSGL